MGNMELNDILRMLDRSFGTNISGTIRDIIALVLIGMLVVGALQCFMGYKLFRFFTALAGFFTGAIIGGIVSAFGSSSEGTVIFCAIIFGAIGAALAYFFYKLGVFIMCFGVGSLIGLGIGALFEEIGPMVLLALIGGIAVGVLGVKLVKPVIIICTGIGGGLTMGSALASMMSIDAPIGVAIGVIIGIFGCFVQFGKKIIPASGSNPVSQPASQPVSAPAAQIGGEANAEPAATGGDCAEQQETVVSGEQTDAVSKFASDVAAQTGAALKKGGEIAKNTSAVLMEKGKELAEKAAPAISKFTEDCKNRLAEIQHKTIVCESCGKTIDADSKFCDGCGAPVTRKEAPAQTADGIVCAGCGKKLTAGSKFCDNCGKKVE